MKTQIQELVQKAYEQQASDIYIIPAVNGYRIGFYTRTGIDWQEIIPQQDGEHLIRYLKYKGGLDLSDGRRPQDGRINFDLAECMIYGRISCVGDYQLQEMLVLRLVYSLQAKWLEWANMAELDALGQQLQVTNGLILFAGKMGSGKTTTMHYMLQTYLRNQLVLTIEDPVEIVQPTFMQLEVNELAGMGYEQLLRVALRHHPEVLVIGEIRDVVTAICAIKAALSGHLVLATIHAKSDEDIQARLETLGVEPGLVQQALSASIFTSKVAETQTVSVEVNRKCSML
ncbi:ATPase, T2SS/T4P/T4SS family [Weissella ceti]|uniref:ATPase, T2SS/T4P/T4SS family n=1 Tax=Weissella ceti TaxID=759620 RepID=A0ABT3E376_9LACO|nr:ATPase, T2SS/T4P/T4SS family [Weissella ceti]MCW0952682.1 ATPase, T2SS/T4P/T4SS family [Weissella ceti]QVK12384.1 Flp pilus assembly complex ATPase component TadA [Weissella ceti]